MSTSSPLNYAPRPPVHQRRMFRWAIITAVAVAIAGSALCGAPSAWRRIELVYWQRRCMACTMPANSLVFSSDSNVSVSPHEWSQFYILLSPPGFRSNGTIFVHELKRPDGQSRLIALDLNDIRSITSGIPTPENGVLTYARIFTPGDLLHLPIEANQRSVGEARPFRASHSLQVFAGNVDPSDRSHFTFKCVEDGSSATLDGWLQNDDTVVIVDRPRVPRKYVHQTYPFYSPE